MEEWVLKPDSSRGKVGQNTPLDKVRQRNSPFFAVPEAFTNKKLFFMKVDGESRFVGICAGGPGGRGCGGGRDEGPGRGELGTEAEWRLRFCEVFRGLWSKMVGYDEYGGGREGAV